MTINFENFQRALQSDIWPKDAYVIPFFFGKSLSTSKICKQLNTDILYLNCQPLTDVKINYIESEYIMSGKMKFLCLTEIWRRQEQLQPIAEFIPRGYFCRSVNKLGGVGIWAALNLNVTEINLRPSCIENIFEVCGVKWKPNSYCTCLIL